MKQHDSWMENWANLLPYALKKPRNIEVRPTNEDLGIVAEASTLKSQPLGTKSNAKMKVKWTKPARLNIKREPLMTTSTAASTNPSTTSTERSSPGNYPFSWLSPYAFDDDTKPQKWDFNWAYHDNDYWLRPLRPKSPRHQSNLNFLVFGLLPLVLLLGALLGHHIQREYVTSTSSPNIAVNVNQNVSSSSGGSTGTGGGGNYNVTIFLVNGTSFNTGTGGLTTGLLGLTSLITFFPFVGFGRSFSENFYNQEMWFDLEELYADLGQLANVEEQERKNNCYVWKLCQHQRRQNSSSDNFAVPLLRLLVALYQGYYLGVPLSVPLEASILGPNCHLPALDCRPKFSEKAF